MRKYKVKQKLIEWILIIILINHLKKFKNKYIKKSLNFSNQLSDGYIT
jgi:hypothetical protein